MMGFGMMGGMLVFWVIIIVLAVLLVKDPERKVCPR